jgi:putative endonuclease
MTVFMHKEQPSRGYDPSVRPTTKPAHLWLSLQESLLNRLQKNAQLSVPAHLRIGLQGEQAALFELARRGYTVVARRWTSARLRGDVDLIAWHGESLCFIEVKTRSTRDLHPAESAVDDHKRRTLRNLARAYLRAFPEAQRRTIPVRFDVVSVYLSGSTPQFDFFPAAFGWD